MRRLRHVLIYQGTDSAALSAAHSVTKDRSASAAERLHAEALIAAHRSYTTSLRESAKCGEIQPDAVYVTLTHEELTKVEFLHNFFIDMGGNAEDETGEIELDTSLSNRRIPAGAYLDLFDIVKLQVAHGLGFNESDFTEVSRAEEEIVKERVGVGSDFSMDRLTAISDAADYLYVDRVNFVLGCHFASLVAGKSPEQMRQIMRVTDDIDARSHTGRLLAEASAFVANPLNVPVPEFVTAAENDLIEKQKALAVERIARLA